jgi:hypothetical protein
MPAKLWSIISRSRFRRLNSNMRIRRLLAGGSPLLWLLPLVVLVCGATVINIGRNNTVNTGVVVGGGDCRQGDGTVASETRQVPPFHSIAVDGVFEVVLRCGARQELAVTAEKNLLPYITTAVEDGQLQLGSSGSYCTTRTIEVVIEVPELNRSFRRWQQ